MSDARADVAVIGAGVVGLCVAERLRDEGRAVTLIDPGAPGMGASYGNAGTIAEYAVMPVGTPDVLRALPSLLFDRDSPLAIRRAALPALIPWLLRFAWQSLPAQAARNARALAGLLAGAGPKWQALVQRIGAGDLMRRDGCLYLYASADALKTETAGLARRRALGVRVEMLGPAAVAVLEPGLPALAGAAFFPDAVFLSDPGAMMRRLADSLPDVPHVRAEVTAIDARSDRVRLRGPGLDLTAGAVVVSAGAHSRRLAALVGDRVPLDTERGYHVEWDMAAPRLTRPACVTERGFYLCPMTGRLRAVGTVELGGLRLPPSPHRVAKLVEGARSVFPDLGPPDRDWMGFRPSLPDSLPVIGASRASPRVIHAFGHGHLGVTLAPVTAEIVADALAGRATRPEAASVRPGRFR